MPNRAMPMFHVPDVAATADWYSAIGFELVGTGEIGGETVWARLAWGESELMLSAGGQASGAPRREVDLYVEVSGIEAVRERVLGNTRDLVEDLHDTFYGMREFIVRDPNRFWITFGQPLEAGEKQETGI